MKTKDNLLRICAYLVPFLLLPVPGFSQTSSEDLDELEAFIAEESASEDSDSLMPTDRSVNSLMFSGMDLIDIPRSVSVISPEAMEQYGINDVYDLTYAVPGASVTNYYGVPGIPTTRGLFTSIYFNGMQRVWNRNGYPTSFGSLEAMEYVRGPAPSNYSAASPGGYVNFVPKSPYFDEQRGSLQIKIGSYDKYVAQMDTGAPFLLGDKPSAYRVSITTQDADSYYDGIKDDYISIYASMKTRLSDTVSLFYGGEFYRHRSKENPGWNRVTQDLIDRGEYIVGNPTTNLTEDTFSITIPGDATPTTFINDTPGFVNRPAVETATPFGGTRGTFDGSFLAISGFADSGFRLENFDTEAEAYLQTFGGINNPGADVETVQIGGNTVLTDDIDFTDADTFLFFFDTIFMANDDLKITNKFFIDAYEREKLSSYGYGEFGENFTIENKLLVEQNFSFFKGIRTQYGLSIRYEDALAKTEFTVEPFSRRDLTQEPNRNNILFSGNQRDLLNGNTFWDPFGSWDTQMVTFGAFVTTDIKFSEKFSVFLSGRADHSTWDRAVPFDLGADFNSGEKAGGGKTYFNYAISPSFQPTANTTVYYTYQDGTAFQGFYVSGSVDRGDTNFQEASLHELGIRNVGMDGRYYVGLSYFYQDLVNFDQRGGAAVPQRGSGIELESSFKVNEKLTLTGNLSYQEHYYRSATIPGGFVPLTPEEYTRFAGIFYADFGGRPNPGGTRYGIPEWTASLLAVYDFGNGFGISGGPNYVDSMYGNPDKTLTLPSYTLWNANIYYRSDIWEVTLAAKNLTEEDYFHPFDAFAANAIILKGLPTTAELRFTFNF